MLHKVQSDLTLYRRKRHRYDDSVAKMVMEVVYQSLSSEKQEFLALKYGHKKQMVAISLELNISLAQLNIRQRVILERVADFMLYRLREKDVFGRAKIFNWSNCWRKSWTLREVAIPNANS